MFGAIADVIAVYDMMGSQVACAQNSSSIIVNRPAGIYIVNAVVDGETIVQKIIVK